MPAPQSVKRVCRDCGWHIIRSQGDLLSPGDLILSCPKCGSTNIREVPATAAERLDPIERARSAAHELRRLLGRR
ncbi:MAG: hypothetical protein HY898_23645 [Deltaproteobacteria bacterium]|nr:hypothetical protein [Deltaproteobacteria bacterium]